MRIYLKQINYITGNFTGHVESLFEFEELKKSMGDQMRLTLWTQNFLARMK